MRIHSVLCTLSLSISLALTGSIATASAADTHAAAAKHGSGDAVALSVLAVVDQHEVELGDQALSKGVDGGVRDFASNMKLEHGKNLEQARALASSKSLSIADTGPAKAAKAKGAAETARLAKLQGATYARAYVNAMVKGHAEVLAKLDRVLIPHASDAQVVALLKETRSHVAAHLAAAKALQTKPAS